MINKNSAIHLEGALFHRDFIESLTERNIEQKIKRELYSLTGAESLKEKIHRSWNELLLKWNAWSKLRQEEKQLSHKDWNKDELDHERLKTKIEFLSELFSELGYSIPNSLGIEKKLNSNSYKLDYIEDNQIHCCLPVCGKISTPSVIFLYCAKVQMKTRLWNVK